MQLHTPCRALQISLKFLVYPALLGLPCEAILCYSATEEIIFIVLRLGFSVSAALSLPPVGEIFSVNSVPTNVTTSRCTLILAALLP